MWFPPAEEIVALHEVIISRTGGANGILNRGAVASALERAKWGPFEDGGDVAERAAFILRGVALDHPFADGNKRTALEATDLVLRRNGFAIEASTEDLVSFMLDVVREGLNIRQISAWLRRRVRKIDVGEG